MRFQLRSVQDRNGVLLVILFFFLTPILALKSKLYASPLELVYSSITLEQAGLTAYSQDLFVLHSAQAVYVK